MVTGLQVTAQLSTALEPHLPHLETAITGKSGLGDDL